MKQIIRIEELAMTIAAMYLATTLHLSISWWAYVLLFFSPDISMLGYTINDKAGAITYNLFHHKGVALAIALTGIVTNNEYVLFAGLILFAHASFDRIMGYGLKHFTGFKHTHLGDMGKKK